VDTTSKAVTQCPKTVIKQYKKRCPSKIRIERGNGSVKSHPSRITEKNEVVMQSSDVFVRRSRDCCITICNYIVILHSFGDRQPFVRKRQRGKLHAERIPFPETQPLKSATRRLV
jgi:hypothetical protein